VLSGRSLAVVVIAAVLSVALAAPAAAHHGHDSMRPTTNYFEECATDNFCTTDNSTLTYFSQGSLAPYSRTQIRSVLENQFAPTDLSVSRQDTPSYEGSAETDIVYRIGWLPPGVGAAAQCDDPIGLWKCDQHYVTFGNDFWAQHVTCHESGHAVGLTHPQDASPALPGSHASFACMKTVDNYNANGLGAHNVSQINGEY
jgi:hypothetical protein